MQLDSVNRVLLVERSDNTTKLAEFTTSIANLQNEASRFQSDYNKMKSDLQISKYENVELVRQLNNKKQEVVILKDSISKIQMNIHHSLVDEAVEIGKQYFLTNGIKGDIYEYLNNFRLIGSYTYTGTQGGNPSWSAAEGDIDPYTWFSETVTFFDKGIVFWEFAEHEGAGYQLFVPMLSVDEGKRQFEKLCKNMGGCIPPEDVEVDFSEFNGGVLLSWGGGC
ncbi:MAG: hypothetical protein ACKO7P_14045 [Bacteroidota bacterium]